jgi:hypothetical protein
MALAVPKVDDIPLSQVIADALTRAAKAKGEAFKAERLYKRVRQQSFLDIGKQENVATRDAMADTHELVKRYEDEWIAAEGRYNLARAEADGFMTRFEQWRSLEASNRAEMQLR